MDFWLFPFLALAAILTEALTGYPQVLFRWIGHPVTWIGALIAALDDALNRPEHGEDIRRALGVVALAIIIGLPTLAAFLLDRLIGFHPIGFAALAILASTLLAQRSLYVHVAQVSVGLRVSLEEGRTAVGRIVGRNPAYLDEAGVSRAAIESLAENLSDGIVAPVFYMTILGFPGGVAYKAVNTADSMIGHKTERHGAFGWASARFDDLVNLPASRLSALFLVLAAATMRGASPRQAVQAVFRDAQHHRSPNAGWPEAATAGALGLALNGPKVYGNTRVNDATMGNGRRDVGPDDIDRALALYVRALTIQAIIVFIAALGLALL
ncbi:Cobalamin biosynthesis protein CobD [Hartmannibacter diazotrophicus]|uniref:Cobalamin biosynthesis protein CobD n=1 Tax=Hartmannibacter diazotrophicus TaxID=1482074 RepID=A0A2C9DB27_9HYPH|nr:adenosylcobinamide-phosphate synthase CbiB [Hartmannibacter diazotrophicus]SON57497.1 Cobalamin biosynthesis protein CobD [Hartmannibacter diazotrophicus]